MKLPTYHSIPTPPPIHPSLHTEQILPPGITKPKLPIINKDSMLCYVKTELFKYLFSYFEFGWFVGLFVMVLVDLGELVHVRV